MKATITQIAIVEDNLEVSDFLVSTFNKSKEFSCYQAYKNAEEAISFLLQSDVDIVIVDIGLPGISGIECVRQVKVLRPDILFIMYTIFEKDDEIFESLKAGANGYLVKSPSEDAILEAVKEVLNGGSPMSPSIARKVTNFFFNGHSNIKELKLLGKREKEVLELLSKGLLYKEIAEEMGIVIGTVKVHINKIYKKLHVQTRTEAINKYLGRKF